MPVHASEIQKPIREVRLDITTGALLSATAARYASVNEYVMQFSSPLSTLPAAGIFVFYDPVAPQLRLLLETTREPACEQCHLSLDDCSCSF